MAKPNEVLQMLCPNVEYVLRGEKYTDINWVNGEAAITEAEFKAGFAKYDAWKTNQNAEKAEAKEAAQGKLAALGLTVEDLQALGL
jgi:hypothetical protein